MTYDPNALNIYVDGSAYRNPGHESGFSVLVQYPESLNREIEEAYSGSYSRSTNNRAELLACIKALGFVVDNARDLGVSRAVIYTDSMYVFDHQNTVFSWRSNKWRKSDGSNVENIDLWKKFISMKNKLTVPTDIKWEEGKSSEITKRVDELAKKAAKSPIKIDDAGYRPSKVARSKTSGNMSSTPLISQEYPVTIRIYRKEFKKTPGKEEYKLYFDLFSKEDGDFVLKHFAFLAVEEISGVHRNHCYEVYLDEEETYPVIKKIIPLEDCP